MSGLTPTAIKEEARQRARSQRKPSDLQRGIPQKLSELRFNLYWKAKNEPGRRFYTLYDRIYRDDTLQTAYRLVTAEDKAPGVDGIRREDIEKAPGGVEAFLASIQQDLKTWQYRPSVVRRVYIPKANGDLRPLGIPTLRGHVGGVVQRAALLILEPIFEADFENCSYGFGPGKTAHQALAAIRDGISRGLNQVYDADLKSYFETIPHDPPRQTHGEGRTPRQRWFGAEPDPNVARHAGDGTAHGRWSGGREAQRKAACDAANGGQERRAESSPPCW